MTTLIGAGKLGGRKYLPSVLTRIRFRLVSDPQTTKNYKIERIYLKTKVMIRVYGLEFSRIGLIRLNRCYEHILNNFY